MRRCLWQHLLAVYDRCLQRGEHNCEDLLGERERDGEWEWGRGGRGRGGEGERVVERGPTSLCIAKFSLNYEPTETPAEFTANDISING